MDFSAKLRLYWANKTINYSILILITLLGVVVPAWYYGQNTLITPLILGVIAAALAESDDSFTGRLKALTLTFICFAVAAFSIELLFDTPWLFAIGLLFQPSLLLYSGQLALNTQYRVWFSLSCHLYNAWGTREHQPLVSTASTVNWRRLVLLHVDDLADSVANATCAAKPSHGIRSNR